MPLGQTHAAQSNARLQSATRASCCVKEPAKMLMRLPLACGFRQAYDNCAGRSRGDNAHKMDRKEKARFIPRTTCLKPLRQRIGREWKQQDKPTCASSKAWCAAQLQRPEYDMVLVVLPPLHRCWQRRCQIDELRPSCCSTPDMCVCVCVLCRFELPPAHALRRPPVPSELLRPSNRSSAGVDRDLATPA